MKVWITKYALTDGIIEATGYKFEETRYEVYNEKGEYCGSFRPGKYLFMDKQSAVKKAEEMRQKKIASLKKQIEKLERMRFE